MEFKKILERYHISPLKYEDNVILEEKDYFTLFQMLQKYYYVKQLCENVGIPTINSTLLKEVQKSRNNCIFPLTDEELMDIIMEQNSQGVIS